MQSDQSVSWCAARTRSRVATWLSFPALPTTTVLPFKSKGNEGILTQHDDMILLQCMSPLMALRLPTCALEQVGSHLGYTGRQINVVRHGRPWPMLSNKSAASC